MSSVFTRPSLALSAVGALVFACSTGTGTAIPQMTVTALPLTAAPTTAGAAALAGQVTPGSGCTAMAAQVMLYTGGSALYQTSAPPYGNFEIQANPGTYTLVAQTGNGCGVVQSITLTANQAAQVTLTLVPGGGGASTGYVPSTGVIPPCYYSYYGCTGSYYPGSGGVGLGKPNIYLSGPPGTEVKVALKSGPGVNLLVATPVHGPSGWDVTIAPDGKQLVSGAATYPYLFYDLRLGAEKFTDSLSFCVESSDLEPTLEKYLAGAGFEAAEIKDFGDYWTARFPPAESYCVYPQENTVADVAVPLEVSPRPSKSTRVWFLVVPQKWPKKESQMARFLEPRRKKSARETLFARFDQRVKPATRGLASDGITLREWGVALIFE